MPETKIEWSDYAINFLSWKCIKVSPGCANCYAERRALQYGKVFRGVPQWREEAYDELRNVPAGSTIFLNTHSDTYHEGLAVERIIHLHDIIGQYPQYIFLVLTKRIGRAAELAPRLKWPENLWLGTSVETQRYTERIRTLQSIPAAHRFVSFEPLLEAVMPESWQGVGWAVCGGESAKIPRRFDKAWARYLWQACQREGIPFFYKQGMGTTPGQDRLLDGRLVEEYPPEFEAWQQRYAVRPEQMSLL